MTEAVAQKSDLKKLLLSSPALQKLPAEKLNALVASVETLDPATAHQVEEALMREQQQLAQLKAEYDAQVRALFEEYTTAMKQKETTMVREFREEMEGADRSKESEILGQLLTELDKL